MKVAVRDFRGGIMAEGRNVETEVKRIIKEQLDVDEADIKLESSFIDDLGADSLGLVELVLAFEESFELDIPTRIRKRSRPSKTRLTTSRNTQAANSNIRTVSTQLSGSRFRYGTRCRYRNWHGYPFGARYRLDLASSRCRKERCIGNYAFSGN